MTSPLRLAFTASILVNMLYADEKKPTFTEAKGKFVKKIQTLAGNDRTAAIATLIQDSRKLAKAYPQEYEAWNFVLQSTEFIDDKKQRKATLGELKLLKDKKFSVIAKTAEGRLWLLSKSLGKPLDLKFTALDDRKVNLAKLKGKVVLIDFWTTW